MKLPVNYDKLHWTERKKVREEYTRIQGGKCHHCGCDLTGPPAGKVLARKVNKSLFPDQFFKWTVHLHHNHSTGMTIGAVHSYCNAVLWQYYGE